MVKLKLLFLFAVCVSESIALNNSTGDKLNSVVNAGLFEQDFDREFQTYWKHNRTSNEKFMEILKIPHHPNLRLEGVPECLYPKKCLICRALTYSLLSYYRRNSDENISDYLHELCTTITPIQNYACRGGIEIFSPAIKYILKHRIDELSSDRICGILFQYNECSANKTLLDFTVSSNREPVINQSKQYTFAGSETNITIAHLSDFHYDPYYAAGSSSECIDFICCRNTSIPKENSTGKAAGYWGDYNFCDSPGYLIENICSQVPANHKNIDIIYYTGDFTDHFEWLTTRASVKKSIAFITNEIKKKFPKVPVAMVIGNHDIHPSDQYAPSTITDDSVSTKWLYDFVADLWADWLPQSALETLRIGGYYSFVVRPGLRVVALNNNLCFTVNVWLLYGTSEMQTQLEWLRDTLSAAETIGEKVHILGHIPPNTASCTRAWNREYNKLVRQFAHVISGQFNGHTHSDEFTLYYLPASKIAVNVAWTGGSGTSFVGLNSNYRIYYAEPSTFEIIDHETWIFNLTEANLTPTQSPKWFKEYSFRDAYGVSDLSPATLSTLVNEKWRQDPSLLAKFWRFKIKQADVQLATGCDSKCLEQRLLETNGEIEYNFYQ